MNAVGDLVESAGPASEAVDAAAAVNTDTMQVDSAGPAVVLYEEKVTELESSGGAFQPDLTEALLGLGNAYMSRGDYENAEAAFRRALHNSRVNYGLYAVEQLPILEPLIKVNSITGDWEDLEQNYHYLHWVSKRIYGADDDRMLPVIERVGRWHLRSYAAGDDEYSFSHLAAADDLFHEAIQIIEANYGENDPRLLNPLYGIVLTSYQVASFLSQGGVVEESRSAGRNATRGGRRQLLETARFREDTILKAYIKGKSAMERIVAIHDERPDLPLESDAIARVHLGDWYLLFNKWNSSQEAYSNAYELLTESGLPQEDIDRFFAQPRSLPAIPFLDEETEEAEASEATNSPYVLVTFDVSESGKAKNIEIVESNPEDSISLRRRARNSVSAAKFRPRFENGIPAEQTGVSLRMVFNE
ncbi:MAG: energy transducer TonB [Xanthomonadales bacterium]|nr:energy transducer TonB [Xanthomonadales bacterium]